jgi:hypothetical protein
MLRSSHARSTHRAFATLRVRPRLGGAALTGGSARSGAAGQVARDAKAAGLRADGAREAPRGARCRGGDRIEAGSALIPAKVHA